MTRAIQSVFLMILSIVLSGCSLAKFMVEHAPYEVLETADEFEIRHYQQLILVTTPMQIALGEQGEKDEDSAFMRLFGFISGDNASEQEISMTAPVFMDENKSESMSFVLPQSFDRNSVPEPTSANVNIREMNDQVFAVIRFNGSLDEETIAERKAELMAWLSERGLPKTGTTLVAGYDPPTSIPWFRRNEVLIPIQWPAG